VRSTPEPPGTSAQGHVTLAGVDFEGIFVEERRTPENGWDPGELGLGQEKDAALDILAQAEANEDLARPSAHLGCDALWAGL